MFNIMKNIFTLQTFYKISSIFIIGLIIRLLINNFGNLFLFIPLIFTNFINENSNYMLLMDSKKDNLINFFYKPSIKLPNTFNVDNNDNSSTSYENYQKFISTGNKEFTSKMLLDKSKNYLNEFLTHYKEATHLTPIEKQNIYIKLAKLNSEQNTKKEIFDALPDRLKPFYEAFLAKKEGRLRSTHEVFNVFSLEFTRGWKK